MSTRRALLRNAGLLFGAFGVDTLGLSRALAQTTGGKPKTLVTLFMRGGVDGLSMVPPVGDPAYAALRPTLRLLAPGSGGDDAALKLDSTFALHPALDALLPLYTSGKLLAVHAVGQASPSRSHFDAQDFLESGTPGRRANSGWLNRALSTLPPGDASALRAVAIQNGLPLALQGDAEAVAFASLKDFKVANAGGGAPSFEALYANAVDDALKGAAQDAFKTLDQLQGQGIANAPPKNGAKYPPGALGKRLQDLARLIHAGMGLQLAATEAGGFDTHLGQGAGKGQLSTRLKELGQALAAFATDLGDKLDDVCVVTMTEFGRTARENGTRGTDHGTASALFVLGGKTKGGRVVSDWPGLAPAQLFEGRDLKPTTDVRAVLASALQQHLGVADVSQVFPGDTPPALDLIG
ncbi:MAG: DUF1501 domain-containing protein [Myxococcaceae bacterium]